MKPIFTFIVMTLSLSFSLSGDRAWADRPPTQEEINDQLHAIARYKDLLHCADAIQTRVTLNGFQKGKQESCEAQLECGSRAGYEFAELRMYRDKDVNSLLGWIFGYNVWKFEILEAGPMIISKISNDRFDMTTKLLAKDNDHYPRANLKVNFSSSGSPSEISITNYWFKYTSLLSSTLTCTFKD